MGGRNRSKITVKLLAVLNRELKKNRGMRVISDVRNEANKTENTA